MKILFLTVDRSIRVATHFVQFQNALAKIADVDFITRPIPNGNKLGRYANNIMSGKVQIQPLIKNPSKYDVILTDSNWAFTNEQWNNIKCTKAMIIEDCPPLGNAKMQMEWSVKNKVDVIFYKYKQFLKSFPNNKIKSIWLPHSVDINLFKDYKLKKEYDVLMVGWHFPDIYPYRHDAYEKLKGKSYFTEIKRPNEVNSGSTQKGWPIKNEYAKLLNKSKISITGGSIRKYPVMKYFEIPACRCVLVSNWFEELADLGFVPDKNMVVADYNNLDKQMIELLDKWEDIANEGYKLINNKHTTDIRARELIKCLKKI